MNKDKFDSHIEEKEFHKENNLEYHNRPNFVRVRYGEISNIHQTPPSPKRVALFIIFILLSILIIGGLVWLFVNIKSVIDLTNWNITDAQKWANNGGINLRIEKKYNDQYDVDHIISQSKKSGVLIRKGTFLDVTVSQGHDPSVELSIPDFMNMTIDDIKKWQATNFMMNVNITAEYSDTVELGNIISFDVADDSIVDKVKRNTPINIVVSKGKEDPNNTFITVPDFTGKTILECTEFANNNGLVLKVNEQASDLIPEGTIVSQSVKANDKMRKGDTLSVTVSMGKTVLVPDYSGYTKQDATMISEKLSIVTVVSENYSTQPAGALISQSISANTPYNDGDVVKLVYSLGNQVTVGSYVGQTLEAIQSWASGVNTQGAAITIKTTYTQSNAPKDKIISQDKANTTVEIDATINVTVSQGKNIQVPSFVAPSGSGYNVAITMDTAMTMCEQLNLVPIFVEAKKSGRLPGEVWYQSIKAGQEVSPGTTITLKCVPNNTQYTVPDFTSISKTDIISAGYYKKFDLIFVIATTHVSGYDNVVYQQSLIAGTKVAAGSTITLTISPGP